MAQTVRKRSRNRLHSHRKERRGRTGNRYRAYPTNEQRMLIKRFGGSCRFVKNLGKQQRDFAWKHR
ncbi:MAG: helix-turn-helix domain-containing protein, partial [Acidimicrobiales bacterium]